MKPIVRALIVTDDWDGVANGGFLQWADQPAPDQTTGPQARQFHLGEFVKVLQETTWVGFLLEITKAHRATPGDLGTEAELKQDRGADVVGFRFDQEFEVNGETRQLSDYDMILYFPIDPAPDSNETEESLQKEAEAIAQFMEDGGGFFATGDHGGLGAPICKYVPRVRSMRRWYFPNPGPNGEPVAPPPTDANRHDTTQAGSDGVITFEDQSDEVAQVIEPTSWYGGGLTVVGGYPATIKYPHPLLCSPDGVVRYLPDHMHEGWCEVPDELDGRTFKIGNQTLPEYPLYAPLNAPLAPEVVADGKVIGGHPTPVIDEEHSPAPDPTIGKTFGVIGAWDGHLVEKGRVVVDSTWHHFFNINLTGDLFLKDENLPANDQRLFGFYVLEQGKRVPNDQYRMIMWYFRNIVYWLIPANRMESIWWYTLVQFTRRPMINEEMLTVHGEVEFKRYTLDRLFFFGQLAERYLKQARGGCAVATIHRYIFKPKIPPWEWVEEIVNIWDPAVKQRRPELFGIRVAGLLGAGPRLDVVLKTILGSAVLAASQMRGEAGERFEQETFGKLMRLWPDVLQHGFDQLRNELQMGQRAHELLEKTLSVPVQEALSETRYSAE